MGQKVLILGDSGTGKSASLRNFKEDEVFVINTAGKPLPFKNHFECVTPSFDRLTQDVLKAMDSTDKKVIVIDDAQYIMSYQYMRRIKESGWDKWNDIQDDFFRIIMHCEDLPSDTVVYFLSHIQHTEDGREKIKTMGKMLDEKITIEGLFTTVLKTSVTDGQYCFLTQNSGSDTVKSPIGMFDTYAIDNDLKYVDTKIRNYYEIGNYVPDEEVAKMDEEVAKPEVVKPAAEGGRRRRKDRTTEPKAVTSGSEAPTETADRTTSDLETPEAPKVRRRKTRDGKNEEEKHEEAPAEEKKTETEGAAGEAEQPKRRRRRTAAVTDSFEQIDEDVPF